MLSILIILMCKYKTNAMLHEILGIILFLLFIIHNALNYKWYRLIFRGKSNKKIILIIINLLILISLIITMISSLMISGHLFKSLFNSSKSIGRNLHMVSSMWLFILTCIHLGFHLNQILYRYKPYLLFKIIDVIIIICGLYIMICIDRIYEEAFFLTNFKNHNNASLFIFIYNKLISALSISLLTFNIKSFISRRNKNEKHI